jgi:3-dehydroquinate dehydratase I
MDIDNHTGGIMRFVKVKDIEIGSGLPKIIVPVVGRTAEEILSAAGVLCSSKTDAAEWRADYYEESGDSERVLSMLKKLRAALGDKPLLFTLRTLREGGEKDMAEEDYASLNIAAAESGDADLIDVEVSSAMAAEIVKAAHEGGLTVIGSYHDFISTPPAEEIIMRLRGMQKMGIDIPKIAVMPRSIRDVLTLLSASAEMKDKYADRPFIAISMGALGAVSRLACEAFGSSMTFAALEKQSAPGQLPAEALASALELLHDSK